jgi:hypothetical protein
VRQPPPGAATRTVAGAPGRLFASAPLLLPSLLLVALRDAALVCGSRPPSTSSGWKCHPLWFTPPHVPLGHEALNRAAPTNERVPGGGGGASASQTKSPGWPAHAWLTARASALVMMSMMGARLAYVSSRPRMSGAETTHLR